MTADHVAVALQRVATVLRKRPSAALSADAPARACWDGGLRVHTLHDNGTQVVTDMPRELGGGDAGVSPGWLMRAALASCAVTRIAMQAAADGVALCTLEAHASSRSDARGLLGIDEADGSAVTPGPLDVQLHVRIGADGVAPERLHALVQASAPLSPVTCALQATTPVALSVEVEAG